MLRQPQAIRARDRSSRASYGMLILSLRLIRCDDHDVYISYYIIYIFIAHEYSTSYR